MCGVVLWAPPLGADREARQLGLMSWARLMEQSRIRGLHAAGAAWISSAGEVGVFRAVGKLAVDDVRKATVALDLGDLGALIGHARYSTSGAWQEPENAQPIQAAGAVLAFNGVIHMGTKPEYEAAFGVDCAHDNDGEVFLQKVFTHGRPPDDFVDQMTGSFAGVFFPSESNTQAVALLRNERRPLWMAVTATGTFAASTRDIFRRAGFTDQEVMPQPLPPSTVIEVPLG